jgi:hypothetical protein
MIKEMHAHNRRRSNGSETKKKHDGLKKFRNEQRQRNGGRRRYTRNMRMKWRN